MNDPMSHANQGRLPHAPFDPIHQGTHRRRMVWCRDRTREVIGLIRAFHHKGGRWKSNALNLAF